MPRYFFDVADGTRHVQDQTGTVLMIMFAAVRKADTLLRTLEDVQIIAGRKQPAFVKIRDQRRIDVIQPQSVTQINT